MLRAIAFASVLVAGTPVWASDAASAFSTGSGTNAQDSASRTLTPEERAQAIQELQELKARMARLETALGLPNAVPTPVPQPPPRSKDHNLELYGFTQLDAIQDFKRVDPDWEGSLRASKIPTTGGTFGSDGQSIFSVRQTRLGVKASGTLENRPYEAKFEFDLFGTGDDAGKTHMRKRFGASSPQP